MVKHRSVHKNALVLVWAMSVKKPRKRSTSSSVGVNSKKTKHNRGVAKY